MAVAGHQLKGAAAANETIRYPKKLPRHIIDLNCLKAEGQNITE